MDLFGASRTQSLDRKSYAFVIVDNYLRFTWNIFLASKNKTFIELSKFAKCVQNKKGYTIVKIRYHNGGKFSNESFIKFYNDNGLEHSFSASRTPQQNGVVERKNRYIQKMARTMFNEHSLPKYFWAEAVNTACYVLNIVSLRPILKITPHELWKDR